MTIATGFVRGKKNKTILSKEKQYLFRLIDLRRTKFVLCDVHARKAWLVNGISTVLHLIRSHLTYAENDELYQSILDPQARELRAEGERSGWKAAFETLKSDSNKKLRLYHKGGSSETGSTEPGDKDFYCLEDLVEEILHVIEQIVDHQSDFRLEQEGAGYRIKASKGEQLVGFDFMDVATGRPKIKPRAMTLRADGKGWVELTRTLEAPTLFGKHFGEILEPACIEPNRKGCSVCHWNDTMPPGRDLLAVHIEDLLESGTKDGDLLRFTEGLCLDVPPVLFEPCASGCQDRARIQNLQRASGTAQPSSHSHGISPAGFLEKALMRMKISGGDPKDGNEEFQSRSPPSIPSEGAVLLGMPQSSESYCQTLLRHLKRPLGGSVQTLSNNDDPQVAASSSQSNDATTISLESGNLRTKSERTPPTQLSDPKILSNSARNLCRPEDAAPAVSQPSHMDFHRRKRAERRAEEGKANRCK